MCLLPCMSAHKHFFHELILSVSSPLSLSIARTLCTMHLIEIAMITTSSMATQMWKSSRKELSGEKKEKTCKHTKKNQFRPKHGNFSFVHLFVWLDLIENFVAVYQTMNLNGILLKFFLGHWECVCVFLQRNSSQPSCYTWNSSNKRYSCVFVQGVVIVVSLMWWICGTSYCAKCHRVSK